MQLFMLKSILTTLVLLLAIGQGVAGARLRGHLKWLPFAARSFRAWHRWGGGAALLITLSVAILCVTHSPFTTYSLRVPLDAGLGTLAAVIMAVKVIIARRFRGYLRYAPALGIAAGLSVLGCFATSALWYFRLVL